MTASWIERLEALFWAAADLPQDQRDVFLSVECADAPELHREVQRMLAANERAGAFLEMPLQDCLASDLPRANVSRWKLLERVGEGGLGVVYRAECVEDDVRLEAAVKILRPGFDTGKFRDKFVKERQILAGLDHPGIVRLMDCGADSYGRSFLVMEFIAGVPLSSYSGADDRLLSSATFRQPAPSLHRAAGPETRHKTRRPRYPVIIHV